MREDVIAMIETDLELKDRRVAYVSLMKSICGIQSALIESKMVKFNSLKDALVDVRMSLQVEFEAFLVIGTKSHPDSEGQTEEVDQGPSSPTSFIVSGGSVSPSPSPHKKKETTWFCSTGGCGEHVSQKVFDYSNDKFGRTLCFECQEKERAKREQIENACGPKDIGKY